jgi:hypothetical protein
MDAHIVKRINPLGKKPKRNPKFQLLKLKLQLHLMAKQMDFQQ